MASQFPYGQTYPLPKRRSQAEKDFGAVGGGGRSIPREWSWRRPRAIEASTADDPLVFATRWFDGRDSSRAECTNSLAGRHVIGIAMKTTRVSLSRASRTKYEGVMPAGTVYVTESSAALVAEFQAPCDFVHLYISDAWLRSKRPSDADEPALDGFITRDPLSERLARSLIDLGGSYRDDYAESVGQTIVIHLLGRVSERSKIAPVRVNPLPRWRLRRVREYVAANIGEPIGLVELASAAGLSRMHFAAQFRAAIGYRPHEYLLFCRIERAKDMLANSNVPIVKVALSVGFRAQSHFSAVFKRFTGDTPAQWRRANAECVDLVLESEPKAGGMAAVMAD